MMQEVGEMEGCDRWLFFTLIRGISILLLVIVSISWVILMMMVAEMLLLLLVCWLIISNMWASFWGELSHQRWIKEPVCDFPDVDVPSDVSTFMFIIWLSQFSLLSSVTIMLLLLMVNSLVILLRSPLIDIYLRLLVACASISHFIFIYSVFYSWLNVFKVAGHLLLNHLHFLRAIWRLRFRGCWTYSLWLFFLVYNFFGNRFAFLRWMLDESDLFVPVLFLLGLISIRDYNHFIKGQSILFVILSNYFIMLLFFWGSIWNYSFLMFPIVLCKQYFELSCSLFRLLQATVEWTFFKTDPSFPRRFLTSVLINSHYWFLLLFILSTFIIFPSPPLWIDEWVQWSCSFLQHVEHLFLVEDAIWRFRTISLEIWHDWDPPASWGLSPVFLNYIYIWYILTLWF